MNNFIPSTFPPIVTGIIIFFGIGILLSFASLIFLAFTAIKSKGNNEKKSKIVDFSLYLFSILFIISLSLSAFACYLAIENHEYEITKTDKNITIKSKSDFIENRTYELIAHKNDYYYLEYNGDFYKISDKELEQKIEDVNKVTAYKSVK